MTAVNRGHDRCFAVEALFAEIYRIGMPVESNILTLKRVHIDTQIEHVVYMRKNCVVYKSEGFEALNRVQVKVRDRSLIATLNITDNGLLDEGEAGLSEGAWKALGASEGDTAVFAHPRVTESMTHVRAKLFGKKLDRQAFDAILQDILEGSYSNVEIAAFVTSCAGDSLSLEEITDLTRAMIGKGERLQWNAAIVADKHSVGGLPGNRCTPVIVPIIAEAGLIMPKTSSRAITSPAGTADVVETFTCVNLTLPEIRKVIEKEGACMVWGGSVRLSPADDILIRVERALDIDSEAQMIASVLSKKASAGSTHVVVDIPVGSSAKVRSNESAEKLCYYLKVVGMALNLKVHPVITDGSQPIGRGIGPALEAKDVLSVLRNEKDAPSDLRERSLLLAGELLEFTGKAPQGKGIAMAREILASGRAYRKFEAICMAQGLFREPRMAKYGAEIRSVASGVVASINNRKLARTAKLAGAPYDPSAGMVLHKRVNDSVTAGETLFTLYAEEQGAMTYAKRYLDSQQDLFVLRA